MKIYSVENRKPRIMVFQGSARNKDNCPGQESKTSVILKKVMDGLKNEIIFDYCDLSVNQQEKPIIQPCKNCIGTSGGFHCHMPCSCYSKNDKKTPDLMYDDNIYNRLERCDGFAVFTPINWYSVTSQVKALFDRLVCINITLTVDNAKKILGEGNLKNVEVTRAAAKSGKYDHLLKNHMEGKYAAFYIHGDNGANDYLGRQRKEIPSSLNSIEEKNNDENNPKNAIMPIVWQCRYSGIHVPDDLIVGFHMNEGYSYAEANDIFKKKNKVFELAEDLLRKLANYIVHH